MRHAVRVRPSRLISGTGQLRAGGDRPLGHGGAGGAVRVGVGGHQLLRDQPGCGDLVVRVTGIERGGDPCSMPVAEPVGSEAQQPAGRYATALGTHLPDVTRVLDPFHVVKLALTCVDEVRRRVQQDTLPA